VINELFELDARLKNDTVYLASWPLCEVLLMNDSQYPWAILVPRRAGVRELFELAEKDQKLYWAESMALSKLLMQAFAGHKLNVAALGNVVPQLHIHHVVRFEGDAAWPGPVWGKVPAKAYDADALQRIQLKMEGVLTQF
jgi:diadenosine tetraphosphate (Ap4A) HIT family hydrolase